LEILFQILSFAALSAAISGTTPLLQISHCAPSHADPHFFAWGLFVVFAMFVSSLVGFPLR